MIDHVTYQVPKDSLNDARITEFFVCLEFEEILPDEKIEKDWMVRWFRPINGKGAIVHLVEPKQVRMSDNSHGELVPGLNHFCKYVSPDQYGDLQSHPMVGHNDSENTGRFWFEGPYGLRCEVRSFEAMYNSYEAPLISGPLSGSGPPPGTDTPETPRTALRRPENAPESIDTGKDRDPVPPTDQGKVFLEALSVYQERNKMYNDNWKPMGLKGMLFRIRERTERCWDMVFRKNTKLDKKAMRDDLIDQINFCAFAVRAIDEDNMDGEWFN